MYYCTSAGLHFFSISLYFIALSIVFRGEHILNILLYKEHSLCHFCHVGISYYAAFLKKTDKSYKSADSLYSMSNHGRLRCVT